MIEMLQATLFTSAETIVNQLLQRDPVTLQRLDGLSGKVIQVAIEWPQMNLFVVPHNEGLQLQAVYPGEVDVTLSGSLVDFITLLTAKDKTDALFGKTVAITGDSALATRFQEIIADAQIDWEAMLGDVIGDLPAHQLALYLTWKKTWYQNTAQSFLLNLDEYLKEEARIVPTRPEAEAFYAEIQNLREQAERLEAKFAKLGK